ncbi:helix-turn-helix transcriptional regulator [Psychrobacter frigidicola]|uniref:helix-turn-helix transcriptional regulator n=1 Tax=Psychrobacter frigidicola TaxID=45611 RepID=UPI00191AB975|nr:LuxR C-terminal-related transcriptional regulator [Psychrobacter frigidicola]
MDYDIDKITLWNNRVGQVINAIGLDYFSQTLSEAMQFIIPDTFIIIFSIPKNQPPQCLFHNYPKHISKINTSGWISGAYLLDPFYIKCFDGSPQGLYHLLDLVPEGFLASEYYQLYYSQTQCTDEVCFIAHTQEDLRISLSVARIKGYDGFSGHELALLQSLLSIVLSALNKHFIKTQISGNEKKIKLHNQLQVGIKNFGTSILTSREQDMIQLILLGHSSKTISKELNISFDTVKMHRKNAYTKLNISSQAELFSLVFESIPYIETHPREDPLQMFLSQSYNVTI